MDDWQLSQEGQPSQVATELAAAGRALQEVIEVHLGCDIAEDKAALVSNCKDTNKALRNQLGDLAGKDKLSCKSLGMDFRQANEKK